MERTDLQTLLETENALFEETNSAVEVCEKNIEEENTSVEEIRRDFLERQSDWETQKVELKKGLSNLEAENKNLVENIEGLAKKIEISKQVLIKSYLTVEFHKFLNYQYNNDYILLLFLCILELKR
jgi:hypothetical protein